MKNFEVFNIADVDESLNPVLIQQIRELSLQMKVCREEITDCKKKLADNILKLKDSAKYYVAFIIGDKTVEDDVELERMLDILTFNLRDYRKYVLDDRKQIKSLTTRLNELRKSNAILFDQLRVLLKDHKCAEKVSVKYN